MAAGENIEPIRWSARWSREKVAETSMISTVLAERVSVVTPPFFKENTYRRTINP
jgi:hypothetical protein